MKAVIRFNLDDFDDQVAHQRCMKALDMTFMLWELANNSRTSLYKEDSVDFDEMQESYRVGYNDGVDAVYKRVFELLEEHNISIDNLII